MRLDHKAIVEAYINGESMNSIARRLNTYAGSVKRALESEGIELRHDTRPKGVLCVKDGDKLIEWAKAQGRLVTKAELAEIVGTKKLSPSYFIKYPELGQYVQTRGYKELEDYNQRLYDWLRENNILFKPNDKTKLGVSVSALLLEEYSNLAIQISIKPKNVSKKQHNIDMDLKTQKAKEIGITIIFLDEKLFENMDDIKAMLNSLKS